MNHPGGIVYTPDGNTLYWADSFNNCIRKMTGGITSTVAGNCSAASAGYLDSTPAIKAKFRQPTGIALSSTGLLYISDLNNNVIRVLDLAGNSTSTIGVPQPSGCQAKNTDSILSNATFCAPGGLAFNPSTGDLFVADTGSNTVRVISNGFVWTLVGNAKGFADGYGLAALFDTPHSVLYDNTTSDVVISDSGNGRLRVMSSIVITTAYVSTQGVTTNLPTTEGITTRPVTTGAVTTEAVTTEGVTTDIPTTMFMTTGQVQTTTGGFIVYSSSSTLFPFASLAVTLAVMFGLQALWGR